MKRTFATEAWLSATKNDAEEIASSAAIASPARPIARNACTTRPRSTDENVGSDADDGEERTARELRGDVDRQLTLQETGGRPGDRRERDEEPATPVLCGGVEHHRQSRR